MKQKSEVDTGTIASPTTTTTTAVEATVEKEMNGYVV